MVIDRIVLGRVDDFGCSCRRSECNYGGQLFREHLSLDMKKKKK